MKKYIAISFASFIVLIGIFLFQNARQDDSKLNIVFCDVGQGDGILIRTPNGSDILVDSGPDNKILACLAKHIPFWDKTIELAILTHPHSDHLIGFLSVLKNYKVLSFATENLQNNTASYKAVLESLKEQNIKIKYVYAGDRFVLKDGASISIVGPTKEFLAKTSPQGFIGERSEFANVESLVKYKNFSALLTGDSQASELADALEFFGSFGKAQDKSAQSSSRVSVLQVPHHGSKTGLSEEFLNQTNPKLAVISVGKNNKYGHPAPSTIQLLKDRNIKILRTDQQGDIEIVSEGKGWIAK